ncbi:unnamed protein product, partial [Ectocarpus fasciculatus]
MCGLTLGGMVGGGGTTASRVPAQLSAGSKIPPALLHPGVSSTQKTDDSGCRSRLLVARSSPSTRRSFGGTRACCPVSLTSVATTCTTRHATMHHPVTDTTNPAPPNAFQQRLPTPLKATTSRFIATRGDSNAPVRCS